MNEKISNINRTLIELYKQYEQLIHIEDPSEKGKLMDIFFIKNLNIVYECLNTNAGVQVINIERFARDDGSKLPMYVPIYTDKNGIVKMAKNGYDYKATALIKLLYGFSSEVGKERLE